MKKFVALFRMEAVLFLRDFYGFFFTFVFPLMMLALFGSIYGNEPSPYLNGLGTVDVSIPAYSAMIVGVTGLMAFPLTLAEYKETGVYRRFDATPAGKGLVIAAQVLVNFVMTLAGFGLLLAAGTAAYGVELRGSFLSIFGALLLSIASIFSLGFFFTAVARDAKISNLLCYVSYFVMIFLSGATLPRALFPESLELFSRFLPLSYVVDLLQGTFRGASAGELVLPALVLLGVLLLCTGLGAVLYRKKSW